MPPQAKRKPLDGPRRELAGRYVLLARKLAAPFVRAWPAEGDEFVSAAFLGLVEAAESFDPGAGVKFGTFCRHRIIGALKDCVRGTFPLGYRDRPEGSPATLPLFREAERHGLVLFCRPDLPVEQAVAGHDAFERRIRALPGRHAAVLRALYVDGRSQRETAALLGYSTTYISKLRRQALEVLREAIESRPEEGPPPCSC